MPLLECALIVDDNDSDRAMLRSEVARVCGAAVEILEASDFDHALALAERACPNLIVTDDQLGAFTPGGADFAKALWQCRADARVLLCSGHVEPIICKRLNQDRGEKGTYGVISKGLLRRHINEAVITLMRGDCWADPSCCALELPGRLTGRLTPGEYDLLVCIAVGLSRKTVEQLLYIRLREFEIRRVRLCQIAGVDEQALDDELVAAAAEKGLIDPAELPALSKGLLRECRWRGIAAESA